MKKHFTEEEKREFLAAFEGHLEHGATKRAAYAMAKIDFQRAGKISPAFSTFERWIYVDAAKAAPAEAETVTEPEVETEAAEPVTEAEVVEEKGDEGPELLALVCPEVYSKTLRACLRLYRTRSEAAIDALVDVLFPNLTEAEK